MTSAELTQSDAVRGASETCDQFGYHEAGTKQRRNAPIGYVLLDEHVIVVYKRTSFFLSHQLLCRIGPIFRDAKTEFRLFPPANLDNISFGKIPFHIRNADGKQTHNLCLGKKQVFGALINADRPFAETFRIRDAPLERR